MKSSRALLSIAIHAAILAGKETLRYYGKKIDIDYKSDSSPLTKADLASNHIINQFLIETEIPILSEENTNEEYEQRKHWKQLWIVDPLDGTKEFVNHRKEYTINIALIIDNKPVMGVIYVPVLDVLYFGSIELGAFKLEKTTSFKNNIEAIINAANILPLENNSNQLIVVASLNHRNSETDKLIDRIKSRHDNVEINSYGSSLKLCMVAEGAAHIYPRLAPTMEWDTAAGQAIVEAAGSSIVKYPELTDVQYNKESLLNPWFVVYHPKAEKYFI